MPEVKLVYQQIKEYIESEALKKKSGEFINSEMQYSHLFKVSRPTVRKAVDELIAAGIIDRIPGKGLAVSNPENKKNKLLILINYSSNDGFFFKTIVGCIDAANKLMYDYKICTIESAIERLELIKNIKLSEYSAVILTLYENIYDEEILEVLKKAHIPFVAIDNIIGDCKYPHVITDDFKGGYIQGDYLSNKGHRKIIYITESESNYTTRTRLAGFKKALCDNGTDIPEEYIIPVRNENEISKFIRQTKLEYTAICCPSDLWAIKAYNILDEMNINVPAKVSVFGYGNYKYSELLKVPLTTISMPVYDMGFTAVNIAADILNKKDIRESTMLNVNIIERNSIASPSVELI